MKQQELTDTQHAAFGPPPHSRSLPLYIGSGGIATGSHYAVTIFAVEAALLSPILASAMGFAAGAAVKYWLSYWVTFRSRAAHRRAVLRFAATLLLLMALNTAVFAFLQQGAALHYLVAQVITTVLLIPPGYLINRSWVFRAC